MFGFIKEMFLVAMAFFNFNGLNVNSSECVSMNDQKCYIRTDIIDVTLMNLGLSL